MVFYFIEWDNTQFLSNFDSRSKLISVWFRNIFFFHLSWSCQVRILERRFISRLHSLGNIDYDESNDLMRFIETSPLSVNFFSLLNNKCLASNLSLSLIFFLARSCLWGFDDFSFHMLEKISLAFTSYRSFTHVSDTKKEKLNGEALILQHPVLFTFSSRFSFARILLLHFLDEWREEEKTFPAFLFIR